MLELAKRAGKTHHSPKERKAARMGLRLSLFKCQGTKGEGKELVHQENWLIAPSPLVYMLHC